MAGDNRSLKVEEARIIPSFRNFTGREGPFNKAGERSFCIELPPDMARQLEADGWNVKYPKSREEEEETRAPYLQIAVRFDNFPPKIVMISSTSRTVLNEATVEVLDTVDIANADMMINPSMWGPINGKSGIKAYLKSLYVTIEEDELDRKYAHIDPQGQ